MSPLAHTESFVADRIWPEFVRQRVSWTARLIASFTIVGMTVGFVFGVVYLIRTPVQYESSATFVVAPNSLASTTSQNVAFGGSAISSLLGGGGGFSEVDVYLNRIHSRDFMASFLAEHPDIVDAYEVYLGSEVTANADSLPPEIVDTFRESFIRLTPTASPRILRLIVAAPDPHFAAEVGSKMLSSMNAMIRDTAMHEHQNRLNYLREQLGTAGNVDLRDSITRLATDELRTLTLIAGSPDYGIQVIDTPTVSSVRSWPRRSIVLGLALINGALGGLLLYWLIYSRKWF